MGQKDERRDEKAQALESAGGIMRTAHCRDEGLQEHQGACRSDADEKTPSVQVPFFIAVFLQNNKSREIQNQSSYPYDFWNHETNGSVRGASDFAASENALAASVRTVIFQNYINNWTIGQLNSRLLLLPMYRRHGYLW